MPTNETIDTQLNELCENVNLIISKLHPDGITDFTNRINYIRCQVTDELHFVFESVYDGFELGFYKINSNRIQPYKMVRFIKNNEIYYPIVFSYVHYSLNEYRVLGAVSDSGYIHYANIFNNYFYHCLRLTEEINEMIDSTIITDFYQNEFDLYTAIISKLKECIKTNRKTEFHTNRSGIKLIDMLPFIEVNTVIKTISENLYTIKISPKNLAHTPS